MLGDTPSESNHEFRHRRVTEEGDMIAMKDKFLEKKHGELVKKKLYRLNRKFTR